MGFETERTKINHNALKNDILSRLTDDISLLSKRNEKNRIKMLAKLLLESTELSENIHRASEYWKNGNPRWELTGGMPECILYFISEARDIPFYEPNEDSFPSDKTIDELLSNMGKILNDPEKFFSLDIANKENTAFAFWEAATFLHDFLHDISIKSPEFWTYFKKRES